jgi:hypothetical protein
VFSVVQAAQELPPGIPAEPPPLPGGVAAVFRWLFHVPQWIQMAGGIVGAIFAIVVLVVIWKRRADVWGWLTSRATAVQGAMAATTLAILVVAVWLGTASWDYMQHDNDFCTACHVMGSAFQRFTDSEHAELNCHDCHNQSIFASARQLHLWILDRPEEIAQHAPVPTTTCSECHQTGRDSTWQRVLATAGHRTHMESDSSALAEVMCVTCHGQEVHRFVPATQTCGQADCHAEEETRIVLGRMTEVTGFHCINCHEFTRAVAEATPQPLARFALTPEHDQCVSCHEMSDLMAPFDIENEPHEASCGSCHNPHEQQTPEAAIVSCAAAGCHDDTEILSPVHRGLSGTTLEDCITCHVAHTWEVTGSTCLDCHSEILDGGVAGLDGGTRRFEASRAVADVVAGDASWYGDAIHVGLEPRPATLRHAGVAARAQDAAGFEHRDHADVACTDCHSNEREHGEVTVRTPAQCASCHHASEEPDTCASCHRAAELNGSGAGSRDVVATIAGVALTKSIPWGHADHEALSCADCHVPGPSPKVSAEALSCVVCHEDHHGAAATCTTCHADAPKPGAHEIDVHADLGCAGAGCHENARGLGFTSTTGHAVVLSAEVCLSCHADQKEHEPLSDCVSCHLIPTPDGDR